MRQIILISIISLLILSLVSGQTAPDPNQVATLNKINQEHSNTRKFFSDELTRQRQEFFKMMDDRFIYYEDTYRDIMATTTWKLTLLWAGVVLFITSFNNILRNILEKKRFKKLKESLKGEILRDMMINNPDQMQRKVEKPIFDNKKGYNVETDELYDANKVLNTVPSPPKKTWREKKMEKKLNKKLSKNKKAMRFLLEEQRRILEKSGATSPQPITPPSSPLVSSSPAPQNNPEKDEKAEIHYSQTFEVTY